MGKKERLSEFNRGNILDAANRLFHEKGFAQTTVDDIAKLAEYSKATIYAYFKSKDEIYHRLILKHFEMLRDRIRNALRENSGFPAGYFAVCGALAGFYEIHPFYFESILGEIQLPKDESETILTEIYCVGEEINQAVEKYFKACIVRQEIFLDVSALEATAFLWASVSGIVLLANKKEAYIQEAMEISKEKFMHNGFELLLKSIV